MEKAKEISIALKNHPKITEQLMQISKEQGKNVEDIALNALKKYLAEYSGKSMNICIFEDSFTEKEIQYEKNGWKWIENTPESFEETEGSLALPLSSGDLLSGKQNPESILMTEKISCLKSFALETTVTLERSTNYEQAGLLVYCGDGNYVKLLTLFNERPMVEMLAEKDGQQAFRFYCESTDSTVNRLDLRLEKHLSSYYGFFRPSGNTDWIKIDCELRPEDMMPGYFECEEACKPAVGVMAFSGSGTSNKKAQFDSFKILTSKLKN